jgi:antagonist of KipI
MSIFFTKEPMLTTVQDLGRRGYQKYGINPNGVMDRTAGRVANILLGNDEDEAVLEMHFPAGEMRFERAVSFAVCGADLGAELDGAALDAWSSRTAEPDSTLRFRGRRGGARAYLAVAGGFDLVPWLGSGSTNLLAGTGGLEGRRLRKGDRVGIRASDVSARADLRAGRSIIPSYSCSPIVRVLPGPDYEMLTPASKIALGVETFTIRPNSNRMGFRLSGMGLVREGGDEMVSSPVTFGTVQLLPDGQLIVLMADHQTVGGYPRVANVVSVDLPIVAQLDAGDKIGFRLVKAEEAEGLWVEMERGLAFLRAGVAFM